MHVLIPYCTGFAGSSFYQDFSDSIGQALAEFGHSSERFEFGKIGEISSPELGRLFQWGRDKRCDLVLDLCGWGYALSGARYETAGLPGASPFAGAAWAALLFDQPQFQPLAAIQSARLLIAYPDATHPELIRRICPHLQPSATAYVPPATSAHNDRSPRGWREKSIELLYVGNFAPRALERFWAGHPQERLFDAAAGLADAQPSRPLLQVIDEAAHVLQVQPGGEELQGEALLELLRSLEFARRHRWRHRLIMAVSRAGLPLTVVGNGWERAGLPGAVTVQPEGDYAQFMALLGRTKIALDASTYVGGINDRAFHAAINGCGFITNADAALRPVFGEDSGVGFYSMARCDEAAALLRDWLAQPAELRERAERSRAITLSGHLWRHRVETLLRLASGAA